MTIRFLHLADTHLGARHAAGGAEAFGRNLSRALAPARAGEVDLVLHGGDLFHRSRPPSRWLAEAAHALVAAAEGGAEVVVVAGNHERAFHPARMLLTHPRIHLVDRPRRVLLRLDGAEVAIFGFPFLRGEARDRFRGALLQAGWPKARTALNVLLCHQTIEGSTVGPAGYTFRRGPDVVPRSFVPASLDYAALGHIHRHQVLSHPENPALPLAYPGSTERTSRAERFEEKGYLRGEWEPGREARWEFVPLPTCPLASRSVPGRMANRRSHFAN